MRARSAAILVAAAVLAAGCSPGSRRERDVMIPDGPGRMLMMRPGQDPNTLYAEGRDLKSKGDCKGAITKLRTVANRGPGYENAMTAMGECLLVVGASSNDLSSDYLEGLTWLRRAADAGWPDAQGALAKVHLYGPTTLRNGEEAAYWLTLFEVNPGKMHIGFIGINDAEVAKMEKAISTEDKAAGVKRAQQWRRQIWLPPPPQPGAEGGPGGAGDPGPKGGTQRRRGS